MRCLLYTTPFNDSPKGMSALRPMLGGAVSLLLTVSLASQASADASQAQNTTDAAPQSIGFGAGGKERKARVSATAQAQDDAQASARNTLEETVVTGKITAIEKDKAVIAPLRTQCEKLGTCEILHADVMDVDFATILSQPTRVVGNLPYQISSPLLFKLFDHLDTIVDMHFMLQKEVAERIAATPGDHHYGRLSVMAQFHCEAAICFHVPPEAFTPPPRVQSSFIRLTPHAEPFAGNPDQLAAWVTLAFQQRRKKCRNSLKKHLNEQQQQQLEPWAEARPESLSVSDFINLSQTLGPPTHP